MLSPGWACRLQGPEPGHRPPSFYGVRTGDKETRCDWAPTCGPPGTYICIYTYLAETSHRTLRPGMATVIARRSGGTVNLHGYARRCEDLPGQQKRALSPASCTQILGKYADRKVLPRIR
jgi:hypothetical protein